MKVIRIGIRLPGAQTPAGVAHLGIFDLDDLGTHPGEGLRARRSGLELGEIDDLHALQEAEVSKVGGHGALLGMSWRQLVETHRWYPSMPHHGERSPSRVRID